MVVWQPRRLPPLPHCRITFSNEFTVTHEPLEIPRVLVVALGRVLQRARAKPVAAVAQRRGAMGAYLTASHQLDLHQRR